MYIETHYFADDGTEFDTEEECREYEAVFKEQMDAVVFLKQTLLPCEDMDEVENYGDIMYIKDGEKANALFERLGDYISFDKPYIDVHTGEIWEIDEDGWVNLRDKISMLAMRVHEIEQEVAALADN